MNTKCTRQAEVFADGVWEHIEFIDIKRGMRFRLFESTGEPVVDKQNQTEWVATKDAYYNDEGIIEIEYID